MSIVSIPMSLLEELVAVTRKFQLITTIGILLALAIAAINLDPKFIDAYFQRANNYMDLERYEEAINDLKVVIDLDPTSRDAYYNIGLAYMDLKKYDESIKNYDMAINLDKTDLPSYVNRGLAKLWQGSNLSTDQLLDHLKQWCKKAELSNITPLQDFTSVLRRYKTVGN